MDLPTLYVKYLQRRQIEKEEYCMREDDHRKAAEELEQNIQQLRAIGGADRAVIELAWGAAFHWTAYGCQRKYGKHQENHRGLVTTLENYNETLMADYWRDFENVRIAGWYGHQHSQSDVQRALDLLANLRMWASS